MIKAYYYKGFFKYSFFNILGFVFYCIFFLVYKNIIGFQPINGALYIFLFLLILILLVLQSIYGYLIYAPSTKLLIIHNGLEINENFKAPFFIDWSNVKNITLKIENNKLLNMYIKMSDGKELRFILKKKWLFSILTKYSIKSNFIVLEKIMEQNVQFKSKFDIDELQELKNYLK